MQLQVKCPFQPGILCLVCTVQFWSVWIAKTNIDMTFCFLLCVGLVLVILVVVVVVLFVVKFLCPRSCYPILTMSPGGFSGRLHVHTALRCVCVCVGDPPAAPRKVVSACAIVDPQLDGVH